MVPIFKLFPLDLKELSKAFLKTKELEDKPN